MIEFVTGLLLGIAVGFALSALLEMSKGKDDVHDRD